MLALSRKKNEAIIINNNIEITVLDIRGDQIKLGISAPKEIPISILTAVIGAPFFILLLRKNRGWAL